MHEFKASHNKSQTAIEFLTTYGWALLIIGIFISIIIIVVGTQTPQSYFPYSCTITPDIYCNEALLVSNSIGSEFIVVFTSYLGEDMNFSANSLIVSIGTSPTKYYGLCKPVLAGKGAIVTCNATMQGYTLNVGTQADVNFAINYKLCQSPPCSPNSHNNNYNTSGYSVLGVSPFQGGIYSLRLETNPTTGNIVFQGKKYPNNAVVLVIPNMYYTVYGVPPNNYYFSGWTAVGGSSVNSASLQSSKIKLTSSLGTIIASFAVPIHTTSTSVSCSPTSFAVGGTSTCTATVSGGSSPTGTITWSQSGTGSVSFSSSTCTLSSGSCSVTATGSNAGSVTIEGAYGGDANNGASSGTVGVTVTTASTSTSVSCSPTSFAVGGTSTCTATVSGSSPTGTITWSQSGTGSVSFSSSTCTLSSGSCSVTATGSNAGSVTIEGAYGGNANNGASSGTEGVTVTVSYTYGGVSNVESSTASVTLNSGYNYYFCGLNTYSGEVSSYSGTADAISTDEVVSHQTSDVCSVTEKYTHPCVRSSSSGCEAYAYEYPSAAGIGVASSSYTLANSGSDGGTGVSSFSVTYSSPGTSYYFFPVISTTSSSSISLPSGCSELAEYTAEITYGPSYGDTYLLVCSGQSGAQTITVTGSTSYYAWAVYQVP